MLLKEKWPCLLVTNTEKIYCGYSNQFVSVHRDTAGKERHVYFKTKFVFSIVNTPRADVLQQAWAESQYDEEKIQKSSEKKIRK